MLVLAQFAMKTKLFMRFLKKAADRYRRRLGQLQGLSKQLHIGVAQQVLILHQSQLSSAHHLHKYKHSFVSAYSRSISGDAGNGDCAPITA